MLLLELKYHGMLGLGIQGEKGEKGEKGAGVYICKLNEFMNAVTLSSDGKMYIFKGFIGVGAKNWKVNETRFNQNYIINQYSDAQSKNKELKLNYNDVNLEDEDAIRYGDESEYINVNDLNDLLLTYNNSSLWYTNTLIYGNDGYVKDIIRANDVNAEKDASYYVKIPALRNIIKDSNNQKGKKSIIEIDDFINKNGNDFIDGSIMGVEYTFDETVHYSYIIVDDPSTTSKFNSGDYNNSDVSVLAGEFNEAIKDSSNSDSQKKIYIKKVHEDTVRNIKSDFNADNEVTYVANANTNRYRGIKDLFKNGDIIYFGDVDDSDEDSEKSKLQYMIIVSDENRNKTSKELESMTLVSEPFTIKYFNVTKDRLLISNYKVSIIQEQNLDNNFHKNIALSNLISSLNSFNIINVNKNQNKEIQFIKLFACPTTSESKKISLTLLVYTKDSSMCVNTNKAINVNNVYIPNTFNNKIELYSPLYDKNLILYEEFIKPITNINVYLCNNDALVGCELNLLDYIYNIAYYDNYLYGYEIYDSNHSLILYEYTSNEKLLMLINISIPTGAGDITTKELNIPLYITLNDSNPVTSSWSNIMYMYYSNIMIGNIEYALYVDNKKSIYNKTDQRNVVKILMPIVLYNTIDGKVIVDSSIDHELYTFASMETVENKRMHIYYEGNNLKYESKIVDNSEKVNISINPFATKNHLTKLIKCYAYTRKIDINDISHKLSVLLLPYYINSYIICKDTGMKIYSKVTKLVCTIDLKLNKLKEYSIEILEKNVNKKYKDDISYEITPITNEECKATLSIAPLYDYVNIKEIKFGHNITNVLKNKSEIKLKDSCTYEMEFYSNLPVFEKYADAVEAIPGVEYYKYYKTLYVNSSTDESNNLAYIRDKDGYEYYINDGITLPMTSARNIGVSVKYQYTNSFISHYKNIKLVLPGYTDNRYIPNIKLYIETDPNILEKINSDNSKNFKTYLKVSIDNLYETWGISILDPEKLKFSLELSIVDSDLEYNIITSSDPKRSNIRPYSNNINSSLYELQIDSSIVKLDGISADNNIYQDSGYYISGCKIKDTSFDFTDNYEKIYNIDFRFKDNPTLTNLFLQFYVSSFEVTYDGSTLANFNESSRALYQPKDKYNKTYTFISNKLDVTFNPVDYILCPDEYYKNELHNIRGNVFKKYGSELLLATSIAFSNASIYNNNMFNVDYNSDLSGSNGKLLYTWKNAKIKLGYFQDNIESINITNTDIKKSIQKTKILEIKSKKLLKHNGNIAITYNSTIMSPRLTINQYAFIYNNKTYSSLKYNQIKDGSLYVNHLHTMLLRSNKLLQSMSAWNANYSYVNLDNVCPGKLSKYGNGYMYMNDLKNKLYYAKVIGKFSYDLMTLNEVKKLNDTYVYGNQSFNEIKYTPINISKEPDPGTLFRSFVYNVAWENLDNKVINDASYFEHFTLYPRILYNYDFGTLNVLTLRRPCILDSSTYKFFEKNGKNGRWF